MANTIRDYSATAASNTVVDGADISEGCSPAGINDAIRGVMADLKDVSTGAVALESPAMDSLTVDTTGIVYSGGNVGIGVTPFANNIGKGLDIASGAGMFGSSNSNYLTANLYYSSGWKYKASAGGSSIVLDSASSIKFNTVASGTAGGAATLNERMRIDSNGNLLVGTTTNGTTADGTVIRASAETLMTRSNGAPLLLNRRGTDGAVIEVRNDNSAVGYISANASGMGVYLGGTGSANHLDDYEEGTWTATHGGNNMTYDTGKAPSYVKIGRLVTVCVDVTSASGSSTTNTIGGLPFVPVYPHGTADVSYVTGSSGAAGGYVSTDSTINFVQNGGASGAYISAGDRVIFKAVYYTDA